MDIFNQCSVLVLVLVLVPHASAVASTPAPAPIMQHAPAKKEVFV